MGHHHKKRGSKKDQSPIMESNSNNQFENIDISSILGNLNLDNIDLSKIDMKKVQSILEKVKLPEGSNSYNSESKRDPKTDLLNSLKAMLPPDRARTMDNISRLLQLTQLMNKASSNR